MLTTNASAACISRTATTAAPDQAATAAVLITAIVEEPALPHGEVDKVLRQQWQAGIRCLKGCRVGQPLPSARKETILEQRRSEITEAHEGRTRTVLWTGGESWRACVSLSVTSKPATTPRTTRHNGGHNTATAAGGGTRMADTQGISEQSVYPPPVSPIANSQGKSTSFLVRCLVSLVISPLAPRCTNHGR